MGYAGHVFRPIPRRTGRLRNGSCSARKPCPHGDDNGRRRLPRLDALAPGLGSDPASGHSALCSGPERSRGSVGCSAVRLTGQRFPTINPRDRSLSHAHTTPRTPTPPRLWPTWHGDYWAIPQAIAPHRIDWGQWHRQAHGRHRHACDARQYSGIEPLPCRRQLRMERSSRPGPLIDVGRDCDRCSGG